MNSERIVRKSHNEENEKMHPIKFGSAFEKVC